MLDLALLRKRLPQQLAQMSDERLEECLHEMYALAHLAIDALTMKKPASDDQEERR